MLRFELFDGTTTFVAYEHKRIEGISIDVPLGAKLLLRTAPSEMGVILLAPENVTVVGGIIPELAESGDESLEAQLCAKLGLEKMPPMPSRDNATAASGVSAGDSRNESATAAPLSPQVDDIWDVSAEQALTEAENALFQCTPEERRAEPPPLVTPPQSMLLESLKTVTPSSTAKRKRTATPSTSESLKIPKKNPVYRSTAPSDSIVLSSSDAEDDTITLNDSD